jgi:hypothetical protein
MSIRMQVGGELISGTITINCTTTHPSLDKHDKIVTRNLVIDCKDMPIKVLEDGFRQYATINKVQARIRAMDDTGEARKITGRKMHWSELWTSTRAQVVQMSDADILEKAKNDPEYRAKLLAQLSESE